MNYSQIVDTALAYADRQDAEVINNMDNFLRVVESRVNRRLKINEQSTRSRVKMFAGREYYGLPPDFNAIRDIELQSAEGNTITTMTMVNPEQMNQNKARGSTGRIYTIVAGQIQVHPAQDDKIMEIIYYQKVPELTLGVTENWLSKNYPDCYIFGLMVEINAFIKDDVNAASWDARFNGVTDEMISNDQKNRWSGTPLQIRIG